MPLKKAESTGLWKPIPGYPNMEKTSDLDSFQAEEQYAKIAQQLSDEVDKKEAEDKDYFKNKGKVRIDHTDGYTYQASEYNGEFQITRWKKGSGKGKGGWAKTYIHTRITKIYSGDLAGFDKLVKKQASDDKWEIVKAGDFDAKGNIKAVFATLTKQYTPTAPATTDTKTDESSESSETEDSE